MRKHLPLVAGPTIVAIYAVVMVLTIAVWDPAAAVPELSYPDIVAQLDSDGVNVATSVSGLILWGALGVGIALSLSIVAYRDRAARGHALLGLLAVLAAGAPAYFLGSFSLGMDVADTFGVGGGAHTSTAGILYAVSGAAGVAFVVIVALRIVTRGLRDVDGEVSVHGADVSAPGGRTALTNATARSGDMPSSRIRAT